EHAGTNSINELIVSRLDRVVGRGPARHDLANEIVIGLERKLAARIWLALGRVIVPAPRRTETPGHPGGIDPEKHRLTCEHFRHRPAGTAALDRVRHIAVPALAHENVEPALATVGC